MAGKCSRWMPPLAGRAPSPASWAVLGLAAAASLLYLAQHPIALLCGAAALALIWLLDRQSDRADQRRRATRACERAGEDIGTFARAFDRHGPTPLDPWAVRAVWDALS